MEADYLWSYRTARYHGDSRKSSLRKALLRRQYITQVNAVCKSANNLIAISHHTKKDFINYLGVAQSKIQVLHLGISDARSLKKTTPKELSQYIENSWGYFPKPIDLTEKPFILFIGGADPRRKLIDLIAAFNNLRARGEDVRLVLAGDTMKGAKAIPVLDVQKYLQNSAYIEDIVFLGFVNDNDREWLYRNALAFVYPSLYEGFGLPILEAMRYGTPVITYRNSSIEEVAGEAAIYAHDSASIFASIMHLVNDEGTIMRYSKRSIIQSKKFSWEEFSTSVMRIIA